MKKIVMAALLLAMTLTASAIRPIHKLFPVKQSDGTTVMLYKNGDGHLAFYTTEDDKVVVRNDDGKLCYGELVDGKLVASAMAVHNMAERTAEENAYVSTITLKPGDEALRPLLVNDRTIDGISVKRAGNASTADGLGKYGTQSGGAMPSIGEYTIPVIMVAYSDKDFRTEDDSAKIWRYFNEEGYSEDNAYEVGSIKDYFKAQSYGHFVPSFDIVAKVTLNHPYSYYGSNRSGGGDSNALQMVRDAIASAKAQGVDFSKYAVNGTIPNVTIMYAGLGEATGGDENTIWPHEMDLGWYGSMSGYRFGSYFVGNELYDDNNIMGIGVFCHEFSHALGLPDWYVTDYSYSNDSPFGMWSVMDNGSYYDTGTLRAYAPVGYTAYERSYMGWLDVKELNNAESITLENPNDSDAAYAVLLRNPSDDNEYFILENRQPDTWHPSALGTGVLVTRIAYNRAAWTGNYVNNTQDKKRAMVVTADGSVIASGGLSTYGNQGQLFGNGVNYNDSLTLYDGTGLTSKPFYKIIKHNNGTITLNYLDNTLQTPDSSIESNNVVFEKVTAASQIASGDSIIFVNEGAAVAMTGVAYGSNRQATNVRFADNIVYGNDDVIVFRVGIARTTGKYGFISNNRYLSATSNGISMAERSSANCMADITIDEFGNANVHFTGPATHSYLGYNDLGTLFTGFTSEQSGLQIYRLKGRETSAINKVSVDGPSAKSVNVYSLDGRYVGTSLTGLQKGIYIQNGRKIVVK